MCDNAGLDADDQVVIIFNENDGKTEVKATKCKETILQNQSPKTVGNETTIQKKTPKTVEIKRKQQMVVPDVEISLGTPNIRTASVSIRATIDVSITPSHSTNNVADRAKTTTTTTATHTCTIVNGPIPQGVSLFATSIRPLVVSLVFSTLPCYLRPLSPFGLKFKSKCSIMESKMQQGHESFANFLNIFLTNVFLFHYDHNKKVIW